MTLLQEILGIGESAGFAAVAVSFYDYETDSRFSHHGERMFHAASTFKVAVLLSVYKAAEEGRLRLEDPLHVRNRFRSIVDDSIYRLEGSRDGDSDVYKRIGRSMAIGELARLMITRSSNLATNVLIDYLGIEAVCGVLELAGVTGMRVLRGVEDVRAFKKNLNNEVCADGLVQFYRVLCEEGFLEEQTRKQMLDVLFAQEFNAMIPARLPEGARVAHKTGEISSACHDAGVVFLPNRRPYVLAILTEGGGEGRQKGVAAISESVCRSLGAEPAKKEEKKK
jgi:beta-lactamase class A